MDATTSNTDISDVLNTQSILSSEKLSDIGTPDNPGSIDNIDNHFQYSSCYRKKKQYKKPMELTELEHRTSILNKKRRSQPNKSEEVKDILPFIDKNLEDIYKTTWNKLEKGQRLNRINIYITELLQDKHLPDNKCKRLKSILHTHISNNKINKNTDVEYDNEECKIINIKGLVIDTEAGTFKMTIEKSKKTKSSNKSKSNIDRFIKN
jgi:hypothetical protein